MNDMAEIYWVEMLKIKQAEQELKGTEYWKSKISKTGAKSKMSSKATKS